MGYELRDINYRCYRLWFRGQGLRLGLELQLRLGFRVRGTVGLGLVLGLGSELGWSMGIKG